MKRTPKENLDTKWYDKAVPAIQFSATNQAPAAKNLVSAGSRTLDHGKMNISHTRAPPPVHCTAHHETKDYRTDLL